MADNESSVGVEGKENQAASSKPKEDDAKEQFYPNVGRRGGVKKVPSMLQMEATECGAACLSMVLASYDCWVPLERMRVECGVSRDGSKALNIIRAAREYGMIARGYRCQPRKLTDLPFPMILFWEFNHFVVLRGVKKDKYYINDPASGPRVVSKEDFGKSFTGVVLVMAPTKDFQKQKDSRPSLWNEIGNYVKGQGALLTFIFLISMLLVFPGIVLPVFSKIFIDDILLRSEKEWMHVLIIGIIVTSIFNAMMTWVRERTMNRFQQKLSILISARFFWHVLRLPMTFFAQRYVGDVNARVYACDRLAGLVSGELATNGVQLFMIAFYGAVMIFYSIWMTVAVVALNMLNVIALKAVAKTREASMSRMEKEFRKVAGVSVSGVSIIETLKANGLEDEFFSKWSGYHGNMLVAQQRFGILNNFLNLIPELTTTLTTISILGVGSWLIIEGEMTVGGVIAFNMLAGSFSSPFIGIMRLSQNLQQAKVDIAQVNDVMCYGRDVRYPAKDDAAPPPPRDPLAGPSRQITGRLSGHIEIRNLTFGYNIKEKPMLNDLSLTIKPGERVALVGGSGSGKSTVAKLLVGLLQPWSGEIIYDGKPLGEQNAEILANSIAFVDQEIVLFQGTLRENVCMWDDTVTETDITKALRDADILAKS